jgi:hypothetical protein
MTDPWKRVDAFLFIIAWSAVSICAQAEPKAKHDPTRIYEAFTKDARPKLIKGYESAVNAQEATVKTAARALNKAKPADVNDAKKKLERAKADLESLKKNDPPAVSCYLHGGGTFVGDVGRIELGEVLQVIDESTSLVRTWRLGGGVKDLCRLQGVQTKDWTDGADIRDLKIDNVFWVSGTTSYASVGGAKKTVFVLQPFDWDEYREWAEERKQQEQLEKK